MSRSDNRKSNLCSYLSAFILFLWEARELCRGILVQGHLFTRNRLLFKQNFGLVWLANDYNGYDYGGGRCICGHYEYDDFWGLAKCFPG